MHELQVHVSCTICFKFIKQKQNAQVLEMRHYSISLEIPKLKMQSYNLQTRCLTGHSQWQVCVAFYLGAFRPSTFLSPVFEV